jgi:hypothetical protein
MIIPRGILLELKMFQTEVLVKIKTHFIFQTFFYIENRVVYEIMLKNVVEPGDNMAHAHCMPDTDTLKMCNTYCFSTATMVTRTRFVVTLYANCLSCFHGYLGQRP